MKKLSNYKLVFFTFSFITIVSLLFLANTKIIKAQNTELASRLSGRILLQVEDNGEAWYLNPLDKLRSYLGRPHDAFSIMREEGIGITNDNLNKIELSLDNLSGTDTDNDGLPDNLEIAIGTNPDKSDSDDDGYDDYTEVENNYSPSGVDRQVIDKSFAKSQAGKIFIQVESNGEAWYIDTVEYKRHYLGRPSDAFSIMRRLGLGITNINLDQITIREGKGIQEYDYKEPVDNNNQEEAQEYTNRITVTTHKPELMREFSSTIDVSATISDSSGYDFKEKGFVYDYTMNKDEILVPTLASNREKLIDTSMGLSINAQIEGLLPKSYPYFRAYVITAEDIVYYGETEVLIMGNTETVDSIGAAGTPPVFGGGGGGGSVSKPDPEPIEEVEYVTLTYLAGEGGYLLNDSEEETELIQAPDWEFEQTLPISIMSAASAVIGDDVYLLGGEDGWDATSSVFVFDTEEENWQQVSSMMTEKRNAFTAVLDGKIYTLGFDYYYYQDTPSFEVYDPSLDQWSELGFYGSKEGRDVSDIDLDEFYFFENIKGSIYDEKIYLIGSTFREDERSSIFDYEVLIYDPVANSWEWGDSSPFTTFNELENVILKDGLFYLFDYSGGITTYNPETNEWSNELSQRPGEAGLANIVLYKDYFLSIGGYTESKYGDIVSTDIYLYIIEDDKWIKIFDLSRENFLFSSSIVNDYLYLMGGISNFDTYVANNSNYKLDLSFINTDYINYLLDKEWKIKQNIPYSLAAAGSVVVNDTIYMLGGYSNGEDDFPPYIISYNSEDDEWNTEAEMYEGLANPMVVNLNNELYMFGGAQYGEYTSMVSKYNINDSTFTNLEEMNYSIINPFGGVYNNEIYVFGGGGEFEGEILPPPGGELDLPSFESYRERDIEIDTNDFELLDTDFYFEIYNPQTNSWRPGGIMPVDYAMGTEAIVVDDIFYIFGGHSNGPGGVSNQTLSYNPATDTWNTLSSMPSALAAGSLAYKDGNIYYIGGFSFDSDSDAIYVYNILSNTWSEYGQSLPESLSKATTHFIDDELFVIGGYDNEWDTLDTNYSLLLSDDDSLPNYILQQRIPKGGSGEPVYVLADNNNKFVYWSDGSTDSSRIDYNIESDTTIVAYFTFPLEMKFSMEDGENLYIPTYPEKEYFAEIDWGDDSEISTITSWDDNDLNHVYSDSDVYDVSITGYFPHIYFNNEGNKDNLLEIVNWGNINFDSFENSFYGCDNLDIIPNSAITGAKNVDSFKNAFNSTSLYILPDNLFDYTPLVEDFSYAFYGANVSYLPDNLFDYTSQVKTFSNMFYSTYIYPGGEMEVGSELDIFDNTTHANQISEIPEGLFDNTPLVEDFSYMFFGNVIDEIPFGLFNYTTEVKDFSYMFYNSYSQIQMDSDGDIEILENDKELSNYINFLPFGLFDYTTKVENFSYMFYKNRIESLPSGLFDNTREVITFEGMFENCWLSELPEDLFINTSKVINFERMFFSNGINSIDADLFLNTTEVESFSEMFGGDSYGNSLTEIPVELFNNTLKVTDFSGMFSYNPIQSIPAGLFDNNIHVKDFSDMFAARTWRGYIQEIPSDLFKYNTEVEDFSNMFAGHSIQSIPAGLFDTNVKAKNFSRMFYDWEDCDITEIPEGLFDYNVEAEDFSGFFAYCRIGEIPEGLFDNNIHAKSFNSTFEKTAITEIPVDLFKYNTEVESFSSVFSDNSISVIPDNLFANNINATDFSYAFSDNNISVIPDNIFANNPNITTLQSVFYSNNISVIPDNLFDNTPNVKYLGRMFNYNSISVIPAGLFDNTSDVLDFSNIFSNNNISVIPDNLFATTTKVTSFSSAFERNNISAIPAGLFDNTPEVVSFNTTFADNNISAIPAGLFDNTPEVVSFSNTFSANSLTSIPVGLFVNTSKANDFRTAFAWNDINELPDNLFANTPEVTIFAWTFLGNNISELAENLFATTTKVTDFSLTFQGNNLLSIPQNIFTNNLEVTTFKNIFKDNINLTGLAPELWNTHSFANGEDCFSGDTSLSNYSSIPSYWK